MLNPEPSSASGANPFGNLNSAANSPAALPGINSDERDFKESVSSPPPSQEPPSQSDPLPSGNLPKVDPSSQASTAPSAQAKPELDFAISIHNPASPPDAQTAQGVIDLFVKVYGETHNRPILQSPQAFIDEVANGDLISFVARDKSGKIVAHTGVVNLGEKVVEIDLQLAEPAVRGNKVGSVLKDLALKAIMDLHAIGQVDVIRADCVTSHPITQKYADRIDLQPIGIFDRKYYDFFGKGNLESVVQLEKLLNQDIKAERTVFLPGSLLVLADGIYKHHGSSRTIERKAGGDDYAIPAPHIRYDKHEIQAFNAVTMTPNSGVAPFELSQAIRQAFKQGIQHVSVRVDISHPAALDQVNLLRAEGFYYASLHMRKDADYLVMQKPSFKKDEWCCPDPVQLHHEQTRLMLSLIRASQQH